MCDLISIATIGTSVLGAAAGGAQQYQNQKQVVGYQNKVAAVTQQNAATAANQSYTAILERVAQARAAASQESFSASRSAAQAAGSLTAGAAHLGIGASGLTGDLRVAVAQQIAEDRALRMRNADWQEQQILRSMDQVASQQQSRVNSAIGNPVPGIDWVGLLGGLANTSIGAYDSYQRRSAIRDSMKPKG